MSRIYYQFDRNLEPLAGRPIGGGWRHLGSRTTPDGAYHYHVAFNPRTDERFIYVRPVYVDRPTLLEPRPVVGRRRKGSG